MAKLGLNLSGVELQKSGSSGYGVVPTGTYKVVVGKTEVKETKAGHALILGYEIVEGEFEGKLIKDFLNVVNPSAEAVRISMERLATVAWATNLGKSTVDDSDDLLNKEPFEIYAEQVDDGEYKNMKVKAVICTRAIEEKKPEVKPEATKKAAPPWKK
jgi:Protein of unknown function (DUF669)